MWYFIYGFNGKWKDIMEFNSEVRKNVKISMKQAGENVKIHME